MSNLNMVFLIAALVVAGERGAAQQEDELVDLRGLWKFEIGDDPRWAEPKFDDSRWANILVPATWEDEGFPGYDGYAWYRTRFHVPESWRGKELLLKLGMIDDAEEVYLNGKFVAFSGLLPPTFVTAYNLQRSYHIAPTNLIYGADNTLAIRVYDKQMGGGIVRGKVGIYEIKDPLRADQPLTGKWKFSPGDEARWSDPKFDDSGWRTVEVPAYWETQGFKGLDGFGWYRTTFTVDRSLADSHPILILGFIDDMDEAYVDGVKIGQTGSFPNKGRPHGKGDEYRRLRAYMLPPEIARSGGSHTLAIRVYDTQLHGGIYAGPLGIVNRQQYLKWQRRNEDDMNWIQRLFESIRK